MFNYVSDVSSLTHSIITQYVKNKEVAIDATLGNGHDTNFLCENFKSVYSFDIQKQCCDIYLEKNNSTNLMVINDSHSEFKKYINEKVNCIIYNLGFLPGGDKSITTKYDTTINSINAGMEILEHGGIILIASYRGHSEGFAEYKYLEEFLSSLNKNSFAVMEHRVLNRSQSAPVLFVIEKK